MNIAVIGAQWGDEGKGKIVDFLADKAQAVLRYAGGANAGHTIVIDGTEYALHLIPSGILYPGKTVFLGAGMVVDPEALFAELETLKERGVDWEGRVFISDRAHIVLPRYRKIDKERDAARRRPIGTTGRGIGVTYSMKSERDGIRLADLEWTERLGDLDAEDAAFLDIYKDRLLKMKVDLTAEMWRRRNDRNLFEGAQGALLDLDGGTYPYVSSGASGSAGAAVGGCVGPRFIDRVYGVFKAYSTRVGNGPMPTEFDAQNQSELCRFIRDTGREYGVTTGRPRRCGYLDLVALRYACRANSIDSLFLTHLDVYDALDSFETCVAYNVNGRELEDFPASIPSLNAAKPVLKKFAGWKTSLRDCRSYGDLPAEARSYIEFIEEFTQTQISVVSVGYNRDQTIVRRDPWEL